MKIILLSLLAIVLCSPVVLAADEPVLEAEGLRISAQEVSQALAARSVEDLQGVATDPAKAEELAEELIRLRVVERRAADLALEGDPLVAWRLRKARQAVLQQALKARFVAEQGFPDFERLARERYASSPQAYYDPRRIRIAQIFIRAEGGDMAAARQQAEQLLARIRTGESFAELAREHSDGPNAARGGEFRDWLTLRTVPDNPVVAAAFALTEVGQVTEVLASQAGVHILRLIEIEEARRRPFEQVKGDIIPILIKSYEKQLDEDFRSSLAPSDIQIDTELLRQLIRKAVSDARSGSD